MTKSEFFKAGNTFKMVYARMRAAHPDWSAKRAYVATKAVVDK